MGNLLARTSPLFRLLAIASTMALAACVAPPLSARYAAPLNQAAAPGSSSTQAAPGRRVAILVPLSGPNAEVGRALLQAAQLSLGQPGAPPLDQQDTHGTPAGAAAAAQMALDAGAGIILGPLTGPETAAAAPVARAAGIPMLAFTSDATQAQPGVWILGITPQQQVRRLVLAVQAENKTRLAAILPPNPFGDALATGFQSTTNDPQIVRAPATFPGYTAALKSVSDFATRRGAIEADQRAARADAAEAAKKDQADPTRKEAIDAARNTLAEIGKREVPPPPIDALFIAASGDLLGQVVPLLAFYDVGPTQVRILGPALWARDAPRQPGLAGAWFAAPAPATRAPFEQLYTARYNAPARDFASLAYDAAGIARATAAPDGFPLFSLTRAEGFAGSDGLIGLQPDGQVRRGLAIFEIDRSGAHIVQPSPTSLAIPGT